MSWVEMPPYFRSEVPVFLFAPAPPPPFLECLWDVFSNLNQIPTSINSIWWSHYLLGISQKSGFILVRLLEVLVGVSLSSGAAVAITGKLLLNLEVPLSYCVFKAWFKVLNSPPLFFANTFLITRTYMSWPK